MTESLLKIKEELKKLKKQLNDKFKECYQEAILSEEYTSKVSIIRMSYEKKVGTFNISNEEIEKNFFLTQQSIKYHKEIEKLESLLEKCNITFELPQIIFQTFEHYNSGVGVSKSEGENAIKLLKIKEKVSKDDKIIDLMKEYAINQNIQAVYNLSKINFNFYLFIWTLEYHIVNITMIIDSMDNHRIKYPINDISTIYCILSILNISEEEINKILGLVIIYNKEYAKKNTNHKIKNIDLINELANYYNQDGTFKPNLSHIELNNLLTTLKTNGANYLELLKNLYFLLQSITNFKYNANFNRYETITDNIITLYQESANYTPKPTTNNTPNFKFNYKPIIYSDFYKYLAEFYDNKNDQIIAIPDNLEEFYQRLAESNLTQSMKKHIRKLIRESIAQTSKNIEMNWLSLEELKIYENAKLLAETLDFSNPNKWELNQLLEEIKDILDILNSNDISNEDKTLLLDDLSKFIEKVSLICNKNTTNNHYSKKLKINN